MQQMELWPRVTGHPDAKRPAADGQRSRRATRTGTLGTAALSATALGPAQFRHPEANRSIMLGAVTVAYLLQRSGRRTIGFTVDALGLVIRAPRRTAVTGIESALRDKKDWVVRKLHEARERQAKLAAQRVRWREGATVPYLGQPLVLWLDADPHALGCHRLIHLAGVRTLSLGLPEDARARELQDATRAWLVRRARAVLKRRLEYFAAQMGVRWRTLELTAARTRWGSASADGAIRLNWQLVQLDLALLDYVVVHELAHQREMNHGPRFWQHVQRVLPDYVERRKRLREQLLQEW